MKGKFMYGLLAVIMTLSLLFAGNQPTPVAAQGDDPYGKVDPTGTQIVFWHNHTKEREDALKAIVADFNAKNEYKIKVTAEYQGGYPDIFNKMLGILNTKDVPDIVVAYQNQAATYQLSKAMVDMNGFLNSPKWGLPKKDQDDFFPGFFVQDVFPNFGNARLGFPPNRSMEVLYYNADWLKELGYDKPPQTPEQFKEMACKATQKPYSKASAKGSIGYELSLDASRFASWTFAFGGDVFDYKAAKFSYDSEAAQKAMAFLQDLFKSKCAKLVTEAYGDQTDFGNGTLLFSIGSSSGIPFYRQAAAGGAKHNWGVAAIPYTTKEPVMNVYGASVSIPKSGDAKRELAAWIFLKYYTSTDVQATWAKASQYFPVRASVADGLKDFFAKDPAYKDSFDMLKYARFEPPVPGYDFARELVAKAMAKIADGGDVKSTLTTLNEESNKILSQQMAQPKAPTPMPTATPKPTVAPTAKP